MNPFFFTTTLFFSFNYNVLSSVLFWCVHKKKIKEVVHKEKPMVRLQYTVDRVSIA